MNDDTAILSALPAGQLPDAEPEDESRDGLAEELAHAAPKRWWNRGTVVLAGLVLLAGGFVGGVQVQKNWGSTQSRGSGFPAGGFAAGANGGAGRYGGGTGRGGAGAYGGGNLGGGAASQAGGAQAGGAQAGGAQAASSGTTGTVKLVDGSTIYVQTPDGNLVTVNTDGKTAVSAASKSSLKSIKAGQKVTVQGAAGSDGTVTATSVTTQK
ncbi:DUF5666 domain-containing protein [Actinoplanes sp. NPDC051411]|uniref:DUF5666 domain-containing protein n=1 Tax=Actinoplanes sp. NPDC051411 TaxID=3155522 RepID=UPI00343A54AB